jgi:hypothetical protein
MYFQSHSKTTMMAVPIPKAIMAPKMPKIITTMASKTISFRAFEPIDIGIILGLRMTKSYFLLWFLLFGAQRPQIDRHDPRHPLGIAPASYRFPFLKHPTDKPVDRFHKGKY